MIQIISSILLSAILYSQSECDGIRYTNEIFSQVNVTSNVLYGGNYNPNIWGQNEWQNLYMDVYEPVGDNIENRPLVFFLFGGSFVAGSKTNGDIVELGHDSYFSIPTTEPGSAINGNDYSNYLIFDEYPTERTYLYTYGGLLRDGEIHQTYRQGFSIETYAYYDIYETYEVSYEPVILPADEILDDVNYEHRYGTTYKAKLTFQ